jgi:hypothetical protein
LLDSLRRKISELPNVTYKESKARFVPENEIEDDLLRGIGRPEVTQDGQETIERVNARRNKKSC